mgnify:CR=1 FL=1
MLLDTEGYTEPNLRAAWKDTTSEDIAAECTGGDIELGMNARYVMDVFSVIEQEKVVIEMNEVLSPVLVRPLGDEGYRCVVMPMRL